MLEATYSRFKAVSRQSKHPLLSSCLTWVVLRSHFVAFCLVIKVPHVVLQQCCAPGKTPVPSTATPGSPRGWAEHSCSPWLPNLMGPLLKFTCNWFWVANRLREKGELTMPMLKQKDKIYSDCRTPGLKKHPTRKHHGSMELVLLWSCPTLESKADFQSDSSTSERWRTGESKRLYAW